MLRELETNLNARILITEDDEIISRLIKSMLQGFGFSDISAVNDGELVIEEANKNHYDIIILDWRLPIISGIDVAIELRQNKQCPNQKTPIIMITAKEDKKDQQQAINAGIDEYLAKPFSSSELETSLLNILESPRKFLELEGYTGPDRRRHNATHLSLGKERRVSNQNNSDVN